MRSSSARSYFDLHGERSAASVTLNLKHFREEEDNAILGLHETVHGHVVHSCLEDKTGIAQLCYLVSQN